MITAAARLNISRDEVMRFARECQLAAPLFRDRIDLVEILRAAHRIIAAYPQSVAGSPGLRVTHSLVDFARRVFDSTLKSRSHQNTGVRVHHVAAGLGVLVSAHNESFFSLNQVASQLKLSEAYLSSMFTQYSGHRFVSHLHTIRVLHAVLLIATSEMSVGDAAHQCGYRHTFQLDRQFHKRLRITPSQFRYSSDEKLFQRTD
jgi:AraC-like DNA-binding protein